MLPPQHRTVGARRCLPLALLVALLLLSVAPAAGRAADLSPHPPAQSADGFGAIRFADARHGWAGGPGAIAATADGGATWTRQYSGPQAIEDFFWLDAYTGWALGGDSLLATADGGATWTALDPTPEHVAAVAFLSAADGYAILTPRERRPGAPAGELMLTHDGGRTWEAAGGPPELQSLCFTDARNGFAGGRATLWRTADGGDTWAVSFTNPLLADFAGANSQGFVESASAEVQCAGGAAWALLHNPPPGMNQGSWSLWRSADGGASWQPVAQSRTPGVSAPQGPSGAIFRLAAASADTAYMAVACAPCVFGANDSGSLSFGVTRDAGATWQNLPALPNLGGMAVLRGAPAAAFAAPDRGWLVAPGAGQTVYATVDGALTWRPVYP